MVKKVHAVIRLAWFDLARVLVPGLILGVVVGKLVALRPSYVDRLRPYHWLGAAHRMKRSDWARFITTVLLVFVASLIASEVISTFLQKAGIPTYSPEEFPFTAMERDYPWLVLIAVNLLPIFEEWVFRCILIDELVRWRGSKILAVVLSTVLFSLFHLSNPGTYLGYTVPLIPAGLLLGLCYLRTGLGGAIIAHSSYNTFLLLVGLLSR